MIKRLIAIALVACCMPFGLHAQPQSTKVYRVGFLGTASASGYVREIEWIRAGLRKARYEEGRNLALELRFLDRIARALAVTIPQEVRLRVERVIE